MMLTRHAHEISGGPRVHGSDMGAVCATGAAEADGAPSVIPKNRSIVAAHIGMKRFPIGKKGLQTSARGHTVVEYPSPLLTERASQWEI